MITTKTILQGCKQYERSAQEALYRQCYAPMMRVALRYLINEADAASVLNRAMLKVFTKIDQFQGAPEQFEAWIRRIVVNESLDCLRSQRQLLAFEPLECGAEASETPAADHYANEQNILSLLAQLPRTSATVFNLYVLEGYSHREIGEQLNITEANSKWHLHAARQKLQNLLRCQVEL